MAHFIISITAEHIDNLQHMVVARSLDALKPKINHQDKASEGKGA